MENFDLGKAKLVGIIALILFIFVMVIANAYQYLPTENSDIPDVNSEVSQPVDNTDNTSDDSNNEDIAAEEEENKQPEVKENRAVEQKVEKAEITPLENISDNNNDSSDSTFENTFSEAASLVEQKQLVQAIEKFQEAVNLAETTKQKADCYENISRVYALAKKYGTALSFAQKAYNMSPSTNREILLARLYYKTGSTDKATERMNYILRRDFSMDY